MLKLDSAFQYYRSSFKVTREEAGARLKEVTDLERERRDITC